MNFKEESLKKLDDWTNRVEYMRSPMLKIMARSVLETTKKNILEKSKDLTDDDPKWEQTYQILIDSEEQAKKSGLFGMGEKS